MKGEGSTIRKMLRGGVRDRSCASLLLTVLLDDGMTGDAAFGVSAAAMPTAIANDRARLFILLRLQK